jgi:hypothetical protein
MASHVNEMAVRAKQGGGWKFKALTPKCSEDRVYMIAGAIDMTIHRFPKLNGLCGGTAI